MADLKQHIRQYSAYRVLPLTLECIETSFEITDIPELHDRLIAGAARSLTAPLITNNPLIRASTFLETVW